MRGSNEELQKLSVSLTNRAKAYRMEVSPKKSKVMVHTLADTIAHFYMNWEELEEVISFNT